MGDDVNFMLADKHKSFLQGDGIHLVVRSQVCPKYPKQQVCNIFAVSREKHKDEVDYMSADNRERFLQIDAINLGVCGQACPNYPK